MKEHWMRRTMAMVLAAALLTGSASALFGKKEETPQSTEGTPVVRDLEIRTYRDIPYEAQFLASDSEGDDMTFSVVEEPKKGEVTIDGVNLSIPLRRGSQEATASLTRLPTVLGMCPLPPQSP